MHHSTPDGQAAIVSIIDPPPLDTRRTRNTSFFVLSAATPNMNPRCTSNPERTMKHRDLLGSAARDAEGDAKAYENHEHGPYAESVAVCRDRAKAFLALADEIDALKADKTRLDWLLSRCSVGTHVLGHKHQSHYAFKPFFTLRVQGGGREGIDDAMQNASAIAAIERQFEDAEYNRTHINAAGDIS